MRASILVAAGRASAMTPSTGASSRLPVRTRIRPTTDTVRPGVADISAVIASTPIRPSTSPPTVTTSQVPGDAPAGSAYGAGHPHMPLSARQTAAAGLVHIAARAKPRVMAHPAATTGGCGSAGGSSGWGSPRSPGRSLYESPSAGWEGRIAANPGSSGDSVADAAPADRPIGTL